MPAYHVVLTMRSRVREEREREREEEREKRRKRIRRERMYTFVSFLVSIFASPLID